MSYFLRDFLAEMGIELRLRGLLQECREKESAENLISELYIWLFIILDVILLLLCLMFALSDRKESSVWINCLPFLKMKERCSLLLLIIVSPGYPLV